MPSITRIPLDSDHEVILSALPPAAVPESDFEDLWALHPPAFHRIKMLGQDIPLPRWQQAYEHDYTFSRSTSSAVPLPEKMRPFLAFAREAVDERLNGVLVNWYDADLKHYIGPHRDEPRGLVPGAPIVTLSLGAERTFRLRPHRGSGKVDLKTRHGTIITIPFATNRAWTHEVPHFAKDEGRRISVTIRAFERDISSNLDASAHSESMGSHSHS